MYDNLGGRKPEEHKKLLIAVRLDGKILRKVGFSQILYFHPN